MMIAPNKSAIFHKIQLYRLLTKIADHPQLSTQLCFKGGTCAAMLGYLDRFSVDLDFDQLPNIEIQPVKQNLSHIFTQLDLEIKDQSQSTLLFLLRYPSQPGQRNTLKLDAVDTILTSSEHLPQYLPEIDRQINCHTIETMFANKLVALVDRYEKNQSIAARDLYDIHHYLVQGYQYNSQVIQQRRNTSDKQYMQYLVEFISRHITQQHIDQDLNPVLPTKQFQKIRTTLKQETLMLLKNLL